MKKISILVIPLIFILLGCGGGDSSDSSKDTSSVVVHEEGTVNPSHDYNIKYDESNPDINVIINKNKQNVAKSVAFISSKEDDYIYVEPNENDGVGYISYFKTDGSGVSMKLNSSTYEFESFRYSSGDLIEFLAIQGNKFKIKATNANGYSEVIEFESDLLLGALNEMLGLNRISNQTINIGKLQKTYNAQECIERADLIDEIECISRKGLGSYFKDELILKDKARAVGVIAGVMYGFQGATTVMGTLKTFFTQPFKQVKTLNAFTSIGFLMNTMAMRRGESEKAPAYKVATEIVEELEECNGWIDCSYELITTPGAYIHEYFRGKPQPSNHPIEAIYFYHQDSKSKKPLDAVSLSFHEDKNGDLGKVIYIRKGSHFSIGPLFPNIKYHIDVAVIDKKTAEDRYESETYSIVNQDGYIVIRNDYDDRLISRKLIDNNALVAIPLNNLLCGKEDITNNDLEFCLEEECNSDILTVDTEFDSKRNRCQIKELSHQWETWPNPEVCPVWINENLEGTIGIFAYDYNGKKIEYSETGIAEANSNFVACWYYVNTNTLQYEGMIKNNKEHGIEKHYTADGHLESEGKFLNGKLHGKVITYGETEETIVDCKVFEQGVEVGSCK